MEKSKVIKLLESLDRQVKQHIENLDEHVNELKELGEWRQQRITYFKEAIKYFTKVTEYISKLLGKPEKKAEDDLFSELDFIDEYDIGDEVKEDLKKKLLRQSQKKLSLGKKRLLKERIIEWIKKHKIWSAVIALAVLWILIRWYLGGLETPTESELLKAIFNL